jgi:hypothetical protein
MLPVQFGNPNHFHIDYVNFVVMDFEGTYHAILGRPALTKFMVVPHYSYLVLKMPTELGVLTLRGNVYTAYTCEEESFRVAEATDLSICMEQTLVDAPRQPPTNWRFQSAKHRRSTSSPTSTRRFSWLTTILARRPLSGPTWIPNRKTHSSGF